MSGVKGQGGGVTSSKKSLESISLPDEVYTQINIPVETWTETTDTPSEIWTDVA